LIANNDDGCCSIVLPFGKYEYQHLPMVELCNSPDIFQAKIYELMSGLDYD
jgi:hypothetical protein